MPTLDRLLGHPGFAIVAIPVLLMFVGVFARRLGRRDGDKTPRRNDWAVGTTILLMCLGKIAADLPSSTPPLRQPQFGWLIVVLFAIFISIDHDRYRSWIRDPAGIPTDRKHLFVGVVMPDILTLCVFGFYQARNII